MAKLEPYAPTPAARAGRIAKTVTPFVIGIVCVLLSFVPFGRIVGSPLAPAFPLMAIYYWAIVRPEMFPPLAVFAVGVLFDLLSGGEIGLWAFVYVVTYSIVITQRLMLVNVPFSAFWAGFAFTAAFAGALAWVVVSVIHGMLVPLGPVFWHMAVTVAVFPLFAMVFGRFETRVLLGG
jgi:rod shape-determining protein MreD